MTFAAGNTVRLIGGTTALDDIDSPRSIEFLADGGWVSAWRSTTIGGPQGSDVYLQIFNADGTLRGNTQRINTFTGGDQSTTSVQALADGGFVAVWNSFGQDGDSFGVYQQRYDSQGAQVGSETRVNQQTAGYQDSGVPVSLTGGGWAVVYINQNTVTGAAQLVPQP